MSDNKKEQDDKSNIDTSSMTFESAYARLQAIYDIINKQEIVDLEQLQKLQSEADALYIFLQSLIKKDNSQKE